MTRIQLTRSVTLIAYFSLLALLLAWSAYLIPTRTASAIVLLIMAVLLLLPLRGLLHGRPYTHAWTGFLALLYFTHGVTEAYLYHTADVILDRNLGLLEIVLSLVLFTSSIFYARYKGRELRSAAG